mmetsp:Transcript_48489/g.113493  ORF Transcript_48489/g.113493 Transcript_48489/m.113493 type:complete len:529 (+) Transcript_48489:60-1646(+)
MQRAVAGPTGKAAQAAQAAEAPLPLSLAHRPRTEAFFLFLFLACAVLPQLGLASYAALQWYNGDSSNFSVSQQSFAQAVSSWSKWFGVPLDDLADQVSSAIVIAAFSALTLLFLLRVMMVRFMLYSVIFGSIAALICLGLRVSFGGVVLMDNPSPTMSWWQQLLGARVGDMLILAGVVEASIVAFFWNQIWLAVAVLRSTQEFLRNASSVCVLCPIVCGLVHACGMLIWAGSVLGAWTLLQADEGIGQILRERYAVHTLLYLVLCYFWGNCFVGAVSSFTVAAVSAEWYYTPQEAKRHLVTPSYVLRVFEVGVFRHGGSLALGALLLAAVRTLNFALFWAGKVEDATEQRRQELEGQHSSLRVCIRRTREWAANVLEAMARFACKQAYVEIAVSGCGFIRGAARAASRAKEAPKKFLAVEGAGFMQRGTCELLLIAAAALGSASVSLLRHGDYQPKEIAVACFVAWLIAESLLHPISLATTAILHCLLIDKCQAKLPHTPKALAEALQNAAGLTGGDSLSYAAHYQSA